jgi:hypothetical protein
MHLFIKLFIYLSVNVIFIHLFGAKSNLKVFAMSDYLFSRFYFLSLDVHQNCRPCLLAA